MEIGKLKNSIANAEVTSEIDGVVKSVNSIENPEVNSMTGEAEPFMTVLATGNFRIKGTVNETEYVGSHRGAAGNYSFKGR